MVFAFQHSFWLKVKSIDLVSYVLKFTIFIDFLIEEINVL